jgi:indole-3-glycerol phosphate synthase
MGFLTEAVEQIRRELNEAPRPSSRLDTSHDMAPGPPLDFVAAIRGPAVSLIAEVKRASPSQGPIAAADAGAQAATYERGGAAALSVLTEPRWFGGSPQDLRAVRAATSVPIVRKDFIVHPSQVEDARRWGADAVLLISAALPDDDLLGLRSLVEELGMAALVETHSAADLDRALGSEAPLIGVNARDLETLEVRPERALDLARRVPEDRVLVIESGIASRDHVLRAGEAGANAVLVGESLMRSPDPAATIRQLLGRS